MSSGELLYSVGGYQVRELDMPGRYRASLIAVPSLCVGTMDECVGAVAHSIATDAIECWPTRPYGLSDALKGSHPTRAQIAISSIFRGLTHYARSNPPRDGRNEASIKWLQDNPLPVFPL